MVDGSWENKPSLPYPFIESSVSLGHDGFAGRRLFINRTFINAYFVASSTWLLFLHPKG